MSRRASSLFERTLYLYLPLLVSIIWVLFPIYWMLLTSLRPEAELFGPKYILWTEDFTFQHFIRLFTSTKFPIWLKNSLFVAFVSAIVSMIIGSLAGYALARLSLPGSRMLRRIVLLGYLVPTSLLFIPMFTVVEGVGLWDSYWSLVLTYPTFTIPFCTWLLIGYFKTIPIEIEEAALVDGCSRLKIFTRIVIPLGMPGIVTAGIFAFTLSWNEFVYALAFTSTGNQLTIPVGLAGMETGDVFWWGPLMAAAAFTAVVVTILYLFLQRFFVEGLTAGGVKG